MAWHGKAGLKGIPGGGGEAAGPHGLQAAVEGHVGLRRGDGPGADVDHVDRGKGSSDTPMI